MRRTSNTHNVRRRLATALVALATAAALLPACTPPAAPTSPPEPTDIAVMSDTLLQDKLLRLKPIIEAAAATAEFQADVPADARAYVDSLVQGFATSTSRAALGDRLRQETASLQRGLATRPEVLPNAEIGSGAGGVRTIGLAPTPGGQRDAKPVAPSGQSVPVASTSGACGAPQGQGTAPPPAAGTAGGTLLLPQHDVHTQATTSPVSPLQNGRVVITGQEPVAGQGPGVEFRNVGATGQQMKVRIHLQDPKGFGPRALYPLISIRPLGGSATDEVRPTVVDGGIYCYAGDTATNRGYFEGWISFPRSQPGFQVIAEVVENDYWFAVLDPAPIKDPLATAGPQYFAGADRSTIHVGDPAVTSAAAIPRSIGAFASATADPGDGTQNVLTDTDGQADDLEQSVAVQVRKTLAEKVNDILSGDLVDFSVEDILAYLPNLLGADISSSDLVSLIHIQPRPLSPVDVSTDLRFVDPATDLPDGFAPSGETPGAYRALRADLTVGTAAGLNVQLFGVACNNFLSARIDANVNAWAWADSSGDSPAATLRALTRSDANVDMTLSTLGWFNPICVLARLLGPVFYGKVNRGIEEGIAAGVAVDPDQCAFNPRAPQPGDDPSLIRGGFTCPNAYKQPKSGALGELLNGFDLNAYLPETGGLRPVVTNIDNAWCRATGAPAGCTPDQSLIGKGGLEVTGDAALLNSLGDVFGAPLGGRFRNVYSPPRYASMEDVVTSHRDAQGQVAGFGVVVDPRQVNLALRHLTQGTSTTRTTNGLLDHQGLQFGPLGLGARPEVAPVMLGLPTPEPVVCGDPAGCQGNATIPSQGLSQLVVPDLRLDVTTAPGTPPITFSVNASARFGVGWDAAESHLDPTISSPLVDLQLVSGCQADYVKAYAASYFLCGRGGGGAGLPTFGLSSTSLTDIANFLVNDNIEPALDAAVGKIRLPDLTGVLPGLDVAISNVRSAQRGSHLAVYADLRPGPRIGIAISPNQQFEAPALRFFPSNMVNVNTNLPTTYTWEVRDDLTGQVVATSIIDGTNNSAVRAPLESFSLGTDSLGQVRRARAKLTVNQATFSVTAEGTYAWRPPTAPPPTQCSNGSSARLVSGGGTTTQVGGLVCQVP